MNYDHVKAEKEYEYLKKYSDIRYNELSKMLSPFIDVTDEIGKLMCRVTYMLGYTHPVDEKDIVIRDLMADTFDFLYEGRSLILKGKLVTAYPIIRRAFESLTLMVVCYLKSEFVQKWHKGEEIRNNAIRRELNKHPLGESEKVMTDLYKFFSLASHPNRDMAPHRYLGEGNNFTLGSIGAPDLIFLSDYCIKYLDLYIYGSFHS